MLQGAIIGLVVGLVMVAVQFYKQRKGASKVLGALKAGGPEARLALDQWQAPIHGKVPATKLADYFERLGWLAVIGDLDTLEQEGAGLDGGLSIVTQLQALALAGLIAHRNEQRDIDGLEKVTARVENEGGAMLGLVKKTTADLRSLARTIAGQQALDPAARGRVQNRANQSGPAQKVVLYRLCAKASQAVGEDPSTWYAMADQVLAKH